MDDTEKLKVLVVDDTILYRKIVSDALAELPTVELAGTANNGKTALSRIHSLHPDLITLDVEMPSMDGIEVLEEIARLQIDVGVIMLSSLTYEGGELTVKALQLGAFDFIPKPELSSISDNRQYIRDRLAAIIRSFTGRREIKRILAGKTVFRREAPGLPSAAAARPLITAETVAHRLQKTEKQRRRAIGSKVVAIGISTGGPRALGTLIPMLPADINVPILVVQHMPPLFTQSLAKSLNAKSSLFVKEAEEGDELLPNTVFIAPGGRHMKLTSGAGRKIIAVTDDPPENSCRPSADYLFRSVAEHFGEAATGVIMTGMGTDGNRGLEIMKQRNGFIIAQDEATCTVFGMPRWPIEAEIVDVVAPLDRVAQAIINSVRPSR
ncbi:MAG: chemotaxis response regulator protein-glutamate methylesterase [Thermodesulfobacteriota bacterium]|nr:chemotaxis response regulator protein-glutamate methylesterase [Thermodesulfobacteriota bacterium]